MKEKNNSGRNRLYLLLLGPLVLTGVAIIFWGLSKTGTKAGKEDLAAKSTETSHAELNPSHPAQLQTAVTDSTGASTPGTSQPQPVITSSAINLKSISEESQRLLQGKAPNLVAPLAGSAGSSAQSGQLTQQAQQAKALGVGLPGLPLGKAPSLPGLPQTGSVPSVSKSQTALEPQAKPAAPLSGCFTVSYSHQKIASHADGHACLSHPNALSLKLPGLAQLAGKINPKSVCVLVNDEPVKWKMEAGAIEVATFGPGAGPDTTVKARFCVNQAACNDPCLVKKDDFMAALGLDESEATAAVGWDGTQGSTQEEQELDKRVQALNQDRTSGAKGEPALFKGWSPESFTTGCSAGVATLPVQPQSKTTLVAKAPKQKARRR